MASLYTLSLKSSPEKIRYVGITKYDDVTFRLKAHKEKAGKVNRPVADWLKKHGDSVIITKVLGNLTWEEACSAEVSLIADLKANGYKLLNLTNGGDGSLGKKDSKQTKKKKSLAGKNRVVSEETKQKISLANTGKKRSQEAKRKMSRAKKGKKLSFEHKEKIRMSLIGRECSAETAAKISAAQKGKKLSPSHINNLRAAQKRRREREMKEKND